MRRQHAEVKLAASENRVLQVRPQGQAMDFSVGRVVVHDNKQPTLVSTENCRRDVAGEFLLDYQLLFPRIPNCNLTTPGSTDRKPRTCWADLESVRVSHTL